MKSKVAVATVLVASCAFATERTWDGGGTTDLMNDAKNWSGDTAPGSSDTAIVHANAAKKAVVPAGDTTYATLVIGGNGSTAQTHAEGFIIQTNGTLSVSGNDGLRIGRLDNCPGTYIISNGTLKATVGSAFVGIHGTTGRLVIAGDGVVEAIGMMVASPGPDNIATYNKTYGYIEVSENGRLAVSGIFNVGNASGGKGYYAEVNQTGGHVSSATFNLSAQGTENKYIQSGGTNAVNYAYIGQGSNTSGTYELSGGTFSVANLLDVGHNGTGILNISGTGEVEARGEMQIGLTKPGTVNMTEGTVTIAKHLKLGCASGVTGTFKQTEGSVTMGTNSGTSTFPYIGFETGAIGVYEISGGTFKTTNTGLFIGNRGSGTLDISGTAEVTIAGNVNLGFETKGDGTLKLHDGGKLYANQVKKYQGTAKLVEFDGGTLVARSDALQEFLKDLANIQLGAGGLALETANKAMNVVNCTFNVTGGGKITVSGSGTVTLSDVTLKFNDKPATSGAYVFAEATGDAIFAGLPVIAGDNCSDWKVRLSSDKKRIYCVPPGLIIIFR